MIDSSNTKAFEDGVLGAYKGLPHRLYHEKKAISNSLLTKLNTSPWHAHYAEQQGFKSTDNLVEGQATHCAILEPEAFKKRYHAFKGTRRGSEYETACSTYGEDYVLTQTMHANAERTRDYVLRNEYAAYLVENATDTELSILFESRGLLCKARPDAWVEEEQAIVDVKTCRSASPEKFMWHIYEYGYHRQAALYLRAMRSVGYDARRFFIIAAEDSEPYSVMVYELHQDAIRQGEREIDRLIDLYAECRAANHWPSYGDGALMISIPDRHIESLSMAA